MYHWCTANQGGTLIWFSCWLMQRERSQNLTRSMLYSPCALWQAHAEKRLQESSKELKLRIYQPKQVSPDAPQNQELEKLVGDVVRHSDEEDLYLRFFGFPDVEAIPARITGRRLDRFETPRDLVIVACDQEQPVGYADIIEGIPGEQAVEISMLVRSDRQRQGIGETMFQTAIEETRKKGIRHLKGYLLPGNYKMQRALKKWSEKLHVHVRKQWEAGELTYVVDV